MNLKPVQIVDKRSGSTVEGENKNTIRLLPDH